MFTIKEIFYSLQGEGAHAGRPAVFCRFAGCNLWSGREKDRSSAICQFCDTDFVGSDGVGGGQFKTAKSLVKEIKSFCPQDALNPYVICTGGEPLLQLNNDLIAAFHDEGIKIAIETNGTIPVPDGVDWVCVSPKAGSNLVVKEGNEIKLVYPQERNHPREFQDSNFDHFFLQPKYERERSNTRKTIQYCLNNPMWKLSMQTHKFLGLR